MNFCPTCGEKRYYQHRYCGNCGFQFLDSGDGDIHTSKSNKKSESKYDQNKGQEVVRDNKDLYKYYKIYRSDGFITYCNILNWLEDYFETLYGAPKEWIESEEKVNMNGMILPLRIEAVANGYTFVIELCKQEYRQIKLRYLDN